MHPLETYLSEIASLRGATKETSGYREFDLLGRALTPDEAREVTHMARRLAALILLQPELDKNYQAVKTAAFDWSA
jgi:hypothetical protein